MEFGGNIFELDKSIWTQDDLEEMTWHDAHIYGLSIEQREGSWTTDLLLDLDYIFKWIHPVPPEQTLTFWVAPCTLIFKDVFDLRINFNTDGGYLDLMEIANLHLKNKIEQENNKFVYEWAIELQQGQINLKSFGLEQVVKQKPIHTKGQVLSLDERGKINFGRIPYTSL